MGVPVLGNLSEMSNKRDINGGDNQQGMTGTMKHCDWPSPSFPKIRQERRYKLNEENPSPGAKFFLTHAEIQTIKGFQDKFTMPSNSALVKSRPKEYQILCWHNSEVR